MQTLTNVNTRTAGVRHTPRVITHLVVTSVSVTTDTNLRDQNVLVSCFVFISFQYVFLRFRYEKSVTVSRPILSTGKEHGALHSIVTPHNSDGHRENTNSDVT